MHGGTVGAGLAPGASGNGAVGGAAAGAFGARLGGHAAGGGAVPSATEDIIKLQDKMIKQ